LSAYLDKWHVKYHFVEGQRYTSSEAVEAAEMVLSGKVNKFLASKLNATGVRALGISLRDARLVISKRIVKLGCVGIPIKVHARLVSDLLAKGYVPVISTISEDTEGRPLNVNADWVCPILAKALKADMMIYLTNVPGILDADNKTIPTIRVREINMLIKNGIITGGMIPKVRSAADTVKHGVKEINILDGTKGIKLNFGTRILA
jgi:acetylglutamate kinase